MDATRWLLMLHVTGAFLFLGGSVAAAVLNVLALRNERPSDVATLLRLIRVLVLPISLGALATIALGIALVHEAGARWGAFWVWGSLALWVLAMALGGPGGRHQKQARVLAERLAGEGETSSAELSALLRDPLGNALSWGSGVLLLVILAFMIWKPGQ